MIKSNRQAYVYARVDGGSSPLSGTNFGHILLETQIDRLCECAEAMGFEVAEKEAELARTGISECAMQRMLEAVELKSARHAR